MNIPPLVPQSFPTIPLSVAINHSSLSAVLFFFFIFYALVSALLFYHWVSYGMKSLGVIVAEFLFVIVSGLLFALGIAGITYF
jgi:hypothetical protein